MDEGVSSLARVLRDRISRERQANSSLTLDFGVIKDDMSLKTNTYPIAIPKSDYLVLRGLTLGAAGDILTKTQEAGEEYDAAHIHDVIIPEKMRRLLPGDRVLIAWVQSDAVVLDIIIPADET